MENDDNQMRGLPRWKMRWGENSKLSAIEDRYFVQFNGAADMTREDHLKTLELLIRMLSAKE